MKNLTWQNPEQLFVAQELINKVKSKCCGIKDDKKIIVICCLDRRAVLDGGYTERDTEDQEPVKDIPS